MLSNLEHQRFYLLVLGNMTGPPSQLSRMCVGPPTSTSHRNQGRLNISWVPLPCHLQNGADVIYIIQYTNLTNGVATNITRGRVCSQVSGGPYSCLALMSWFISGVTYSFQVAAQDLFGITGPFSDPVTTMYGSQGK